jgi:phage tail sheath protein FI
MTVVDSLRLGGEIVRDTPPSGHVAGVYARTDLQRGVQRAPANAELEWAQDVTVAVGPELHGVLNEAGINTIRVLPGRGIRLHGARTTSSDADWRYVNVRRLLLMIERSVARAVRWVVFEPNDAVLRSLVALSIGSFLESLWRRGALLGTQPEEAFFVRCDETNNPRAVRDAGGLVAEVGVAVVKPAEFVVFRVARTHDELEVTE